MYDDPDVAASLTFSHEGRPAAGGEIVLLRDDTVQLIPVPALRDALNEIVEQVDQGSLKWGASLVVGGAAVGAAHFVRGKRPIGYALFAASVLAGVGSYGVRRWARALPAWMLSPHPLAGTKGASAASVTIAREASCGGIRFTLNGGGLRTLHLTLKPEEFDIGEGRSFLRAVAAASTT